MRKFAISVLSIFVVIPAFSDARLPVVNVSSASVSARAAFGEQVEKLVSAQPKIEKPKPLAVASNDVRFDMGADVLLPKRPATNLWADGVRTLRMPDANEFAVLTPTFDLPPETLPGVDAQIERLVELQRRADESVAAPVAAPRPTKIVSRPTPKPVVELATNARDEIVLKEDVKLSRMVVEMDEPIVRPIKSAVRNSKPEIRDTFVSDMSPTELKKAFKKTYMSENKHLSAYPIDERFDVASEMTTEGFVATSDLSEGGGVRPLEIKISFRGDDAALSRDNYNLLSEYASIVVANPKRAIQVSIPESATHGSDARKIAAKRLAIVEQVLKDTGVSDARIMPVLSSRSDDGFVLRVISNDQFETMTRQRRDMFGDSVSKKTYKSLSW